MPLVTALRGLRLTQAQFTAAAAALMALAVSLGPFPVAQAIPLAVAIGFLSLIRPQLAVYLLLASVPVQDLGALPFAGTNVTANKLATALAMGVFVAGYLSGQLRPRLTRAAILPLLAYLAAMWASMLGARSIGSSLAEIYRWLQFLLVVLLATSALRTTSQWLAAAAIAVASGAAEGALGLYQFFTGAGPQSFAISEQFSRAFGTFGMPNSYAGYLGQIFPISLAFLAPATAHLLSERSRGRRLPTLILCALLAAASGLTLAGLLASYSRGAWLGALVGLAAMLLAASRRAFLAFLAAAAFGLGILWLTGPQAVPPIVQERVSSLADQLRIFDVTQEMVTPANFAVAERMSQWQAGLNMFLSNPILGVGIGNYNAAYQDYFVGIWVFSRGHAHNYYINAAAETGVFGLAAYLWLLGYWFLSLARGAKVQKGLGRALAVGALGAVSAMSVHNLVDNLHVLSMGVYQGTLYALGTVMSKAQDGESP